MEDVWMLGILTAHRAAAATTPFSCCSSVWPSFNSFAMASICCCFIVQCCKDKQANDQAYRMNKPLQYNK